MATVLNVVVTAKTIDLVAGILGDHGFAGAYDYGYEGADTIATVTIDESDKDYAIMALQALEAEGIAASVISFNSFLVGQSVNTLDGPGIVIHSVKGCPAIRVQLDSGRIWDYQANEVSFI